MRGSRFFFAVCFLGAVSGIDVAYNAQDDNTGIFVNLIRNSRPWGTASEPWMGAVSVNATTGYPSQDFGSTMDNLIYNSSESYLAAHPAISDQRPDAAARARAAYGYTIRLVCAPVSEKYPFVVKTGPQGRGQLYNETLDSATGVYTARLVPDQGGTALMITVINTTAGCSQVSVMMPGFDPVNDADTINPTYLSNIQMFADSKAPWFRTMGLHDTNGNAESVWSERSLPGWPSNRWNQPISPKGPPGVNCSEPAQGEHCFTSLPDSNHPLFGGQSVLSHGWSWEAVILLANTAKISPWINVPHLADDDYVTQLFTLLKETLDPDLNIYVEWSNEVWNPSFQQWYANVYYANASVVAGDPYGYNFSAGVNVYQWDFARTAHRLMQIAQIADTVFGAGATPQGRVRPVLAGQVMGSPQLVGLQYLSEGLGLTPSKVFFATANAPYFALWPAQSAGRDSINCWPNLTAADVLSGLQQSVTARFDPASGPKGSHKQFITYARWYGLRSVSYEGGPDTSCFFSSNSSVDAKNTANLAAGMGTIVTQYLTHLAALSSSTLSYFTCCTGAWTMFGQWSLAPNQTTYASSPKRLAIERVLSAPAPPPAFGTLVPGTLDPTASTVGDIFASNASAPWFWPHTNESLWFPVRVAQAQAASELVLRLNVTSRAAGSAFAVSTSLGAIQVVSVPFTNNGWQLLPAVTVAATAPFTAIRVESLTPAFEPWVRLSSNATLNGVVVVSAAT